MIQICSRWQGSVAAGVEFGMDDAGAGAHALDFAGPDGAAAAAGILVLHGAFQDIGDDLHVAMGMGRKARAARDPVLVDHAQRAEAFNGRVVIIAEGETVLGIQPVDLGVAALFRSADGDHLRPCFDRVPDQRGDIGAAEALDFLDAGGRGNVDLGHIVADHVDASENQPAAFQFRTDGGADRPVRAASTLWFRAGRRHACWSGPRPRRAPG